MNYIDEEQNFYGRRDILDVFKRRVKDLKEGYRQNVALLGCKHVGKSAVLRNFVSNLDDDDITSVYLDLENKDFHYFIHMFIGGLLYSYSKSKNLQTYDEIKLLLENTKKYIPHTIQVIQKIFSDYHAKKTTEAFLGVLALPEIYANETGKFCVLILDEFQNLDNFLIPNCFQDLGKKIMTQKRCYYIVSSSYSDVAYKILSEKLSLLFGNFEIININPFDFRDSSQFIVHNLRNCKIGIQLRNFLADFAGGHPLYIHLICRELMNLSAIHHQNEIYMPLLVQAIENTLFDRWGVISRHFDLVINDLCSGKGNQINSLILLSFANGKFKTDEIIEDIGVKKHQLQQKINRLIAQEIIVRNGSFFYFQDKLFRYWLKYVYQKRIKGVEFSPDKQRRQFKEEINKSVEEFKMNTRKDFPSRIMELLHCFENEQIHLNGRKYRVPNFLEMEIIKWQNESGCGFDAIRAATVDNVWYIVMKKDNFCENDVNVVLGELKKNGKRSERCVIVSLSDLDENARIRALQERFWIWTEHELNTLLTLSNKPYITR
ncbi:MAG: ATP-binding protein [Candidatus Omnitrophica bacterium]|nr:ATP-binding protein [Candidatus Omnitrophota bacterium]MCB9747700.1 ATP-binding protein [Candidatus Omnitrophota bacterium]